MKKQYIAKKYKLDKEPIEINYELFYSWFSEMHVAIDTPSIGFAMKLELNNLIVEHARADLIKNEMKRKTTTNKIIDNFEKTVVRYRDLTEWLLTMRQRLEDSGDYLRTAIDDNEKLLDIMEEQAIATNVMIDEIEKSVPWD